jgi:oxygen-independent coproporphyrinogen III oxidase
MMNKQNGNLELLQQLGETENNFSHYEISNLAKPFGEAIHNSAYWSGESYLGIGPSAHSFYHNERRFNVANNQKYIRSLINGDAEHEFERLQKHERYNETVLTGMRTARGIAIESINEIGDEFLNVFSTILLENHHMDNKYDSPLLAYSV